ncbi:Hypothetical predicted protein, partial [Paramuricea clavata]
EEASLKSHLFSHFQTTTIFHPSNPFFASTNLVLFKIQIMERYSALAIDVKVGIFLFQTMPAAAVHRSLTLVFPTLCLKDMLLKAIKQELF